MSTLAISRWTISTALAAVLEHFGWHGVVEMPEHLDRAFAFVAHIIGLAEVGKGKREIVLPLLFSGKNQDSVTPVGMIDQILSCGACLRSIGL